MRTGGREFESMEEQSMGVWADHGRGAKIASAPDGIGSFGSHVSDSGGFPSEVSDSEGENPSPEIEAAEGSSGGEERGHDEGGGGGCCDEQTQASESQLYEAIQQTAALAPRAGATVSYKVVDDERGASESQGAGSESQAGAMILSQMSVQARDKAVEWAGADGADRAAASKCRAESAPKGGRKGAMAKRQDAPEKTERVTKRGVSKLAAAKQGGGDSAAVATRATRSKAGASAQEVVAEASDSRKPAAKRRKSAADEPVAEVGAEKESAADAAVAESCKKEGDEEIRRGGREGGRMKSRATLEDAPASHTPATAQKEDARLRQSSARKPVRVYGKLKGKKAAATTTARSASAAKQRDDLVARTPKPADGDALDASSAAHSGSGAQLTSAASARAGKSAESSKGGGDSGEPELGDTPHVSRGSLEPRFSQAAQEDDSGNEGMAADEANVKGADDRDAGSASAKAKMKGADDGAGGSDPPRGKRRSGEDGAVGSAASSGRVRRGGGAARMASPPRPAKRARTAAAPPASAQLKILFVGFDSPAEQKEKDRTFVPWLIKKGATVENDARECTHLVTPRIKTSCRFLSVIARGGVPIVSPAWLRECVAVDKWQDDERYFLQDRAGENKLGVRFENLKKRASASEGAAPPVFQGLTFFRHASFAMKADETKSLIECAGGTVLSNSKGLPAKAIVLAGKLPVSDPALKSFTARDMNWIKNCILNNEVSD